MNIYLLLLHSLMKKISKAKKSFVFPIPKLYKTFEILRCSDLPSIVYFWMWLEMLLGKSNKFKDNIKVQGFLELI